MPSVKGGSALEKRVGGLEAQIADLRASIAILAKAQLNLSESSEMSDNSVESVLTIINRPPEEAPVAPARKPVKHATHKAASRAKSVKKSVKKSVRKTR